MFEPVLTRAGQQRYARKELIELIHTTHQGNGVEVRKRGRSCARCTHGLHSTSSRDFATPPRLTAWVLP
jgi:hypothetical protein